MTTRTLPMVGLFGERLRFIRHPLLPCVILYLVAMGTAVTLQAQFTVATNNGAITITGYSGPADQVVIPSQFYGLPVTSIGEKAFSRWGTNTCVVSVTIPDSVTNIGPGAFMGCELLSSISLGNGLVSIDYGVFYACLGLTNMTIPGSVVRIGELAFSTCRNLAEVTIPDSATEIGPNAFLYCTSLRAINVDARNPGYSSTNGVLFNKNQTELIQVPPATAGSYTVPDSVVTIQGFAFYWCTSLTNITVPGNVTKIGERAFHDCRVLERIYFRGNAPTLGLNAFQYSDVVTVYYLPGTIGWDSTFGGRPTAPWVLSNPLVLATPSSLGVTNNVFGFVISWATNATVVVEARTDLANPTWSPLSTNTLVGGSSYFYDPDWVKHPNRVYRLRAR